MKRTSVWYWITAVSLFLIMMFNCGVGYYSISLFVTSMTKTFGISSGDFAIVYIFYGVGSAMAAAGLNKLLKYIPLKGLVVFGGLMSAAGYMIFSRANELKFLFAGGMLVGASTVFAGTAAVQLVIARWFSDCRSRVTGLVASASGIGTALGSPLIGRMIRSWGWRETCVVIGVLIVIFVCVQGAFLLKNDPGCMNLPPYTRSETLQDGRGPEPQSGIPLKEGAKTARFLLFAVGMVVIAVIYQMITLYQSTILIEKGFSEDLAAACLSIFAVVDMFSKASAGIIADRRGFRLVALYCTAATASAFVWIRVVSGAMGAVLFSALLGFWPTMCVLYGVTVSISLFGKQYLSEYIGFTQTLMCCCSLVGMPAIRQLYNAAGSFDVIMNIAIALLVAFAAGMVPLLRRDGLFQGE